MPDPLPDCLPDRDWAISSNHGSLISYWRTSKYEEEIPMKSVIEEEAIPMKSVIEEEALPRPLSSMNLSLIKNDKTESVILDNIQTFECSTSSSCQLFQDEKNDLLFIDTLREELMGMDNICEVSSNHEALPSIPHGEAGIITFCSYDKNEKQFAFYFKDSQDMASVVGVGLQYARVILDKECKIKVQEIPRDKWEQALPLVQSNASYVHKSLKLELPKSIVIGGDTSFPGRPLVWDLAKYFILQDIVTLFANHSNEASSSNQPPSSEKTISYNDMDHSAFRHLDTKGKRTVGGDDDGDTENCERQGKPLSPKHLGAVIDTIVAIELLKGGTIVDANFIKSDKVVNLDEFHDATKARLKYLDDTIFPQLEFNFMRKTQDEVKTIQSTIGEIVFVTDEGRKWIHNDLKVDFRIGNEYKGNGRVERGSYKQLDLNPDSGTESTKMVQTVAHRSGRAIGDAMEASLRANGIGGRYKHDEITSQDDTKTRQYETCGEKKRDFTKDGMMPLWRYDEHKIDCLYVSEDRRSGKPVGLTDPLRCTQRVKFQGIFEVIDNPPQSPACSVKYELIVSRGLEELDPKKSDGTLEGMNTSSKGDDSKMKNKAFHCCISFNSPKKVAEKQDIRYGWRFNQVYKKEIFLNHEMTHLDGQHHKLREVAEPNGLGTFLAKKGKWTEYAWSNILGNKV